MSTGILDGSWRILGREIQGWLIPAARGTIRLAVWCDGEKLAELTVTVAEPSADTPYRPLASFTYHLPQALADNRPHRLGVTPAGEPGRHLPNASGRNLALYQAKVLMSVDSVEGGIIRGWAFDSTMADAVVTVELWDGKRFVASTETNVTRNDVNAKYGIFGNHGFSLPVPQALFDGLGHWLTLKVAGEALTFPSHRRLPTNLGRNLLQGKSDRFAGRVEHVDCETVEGWAVNLQAPFRPIRISLLVDGVSVAIVTANQFQKRLQTVTESGFHAFSFRWPTHLMNGTWRIIEARVVEGGGAVLEFGEKRERSRRVLFPLVDFFAAYDSLSPRSDTMALPLTNIVSRPPQAAAASPAGRVSIIILNWDGARILAQTLETIARHMTSRPVEVIVVDHGSSDDSLDVAGGFRSRLDLKIVPRHANFSFSSSNNLAAGMASGEYLFFVNNDILFTGDCLPAMAGWLERDPTVGVVGMRLVEPIPDQSGTLHYETHHRGIQFRPRIQASGEVTYHPAEVADEYSDIGAAYELPAVTGAALLCRKADFLAVGGFDEAYFYGMEDVDLCLRMAERIGRRIVCDTSVTAIHNRSYTRTARLVSGKPNPILSNPKSQIANHQTFNAHFKRRIVHRTLQSLIDGETVWRARPLRVTFIVTDASFSTPAGDFYTAMEMASAMRKLYGWETLFVRFNLHDLQGTDVAVAMRHDYDLGKARSANPGLVTVAWIRNRVDEWLASPHFQSYNLIFCSSELAIRHIAEATGRTAYLLPIATNDERFSPREPVEEHRTDIVFTGSYYLSHEREAVGLLDKVDLPGSLAIYGYGWGDHPRWRRHWRRSVPYYELPDIYPSARLVIDDSHPVTRTWNSLNSRIFDALGSGALVVTNCRGGARELFGDLLPTFSTAEELSALLARYLAHPEERAALAARLCAEVREKHTYKNRAMAFRDALRAFARSTLRFSIKIGVPNHEEKLSWGDWHFALGLQRALTRAGHFARIDILPDWATQQGAGDDVVLVLRGLSAWKPVASKINLLWLISHPDDVPLSELDAYDHVFVASDSYAEVLRRRLGDRVSPLLQCTDPALFHDGDFHDGDRRDAEAEPAAVPDLLFVANSRGVRRPIIDDAVRAGLDVGVYGSRWDGLIPEKQIRGTYLPNERLRHHYANAKIVFNDHWQDMKREGFVSNRIFDAGACGAAIVSDDVPGMTDLFGDAVATYRNADDLGATVRALLSDDDRRKAMGAALRSIVLARHTFDHRVSDILDIVARFQAQAALKEQA
ncbi:glycosyltransferase family protein [Prosthecodimorpha staleyi]|uniref:Glycosyltransferase n=1 Tax=Prosthecodimorpha staleyi TaxID=2840188 RepID=A0A947D858_9HYPH|nr:glycosyltransferase [Prosthecodimorpha staleyi]MBT9292495.1 glycosyltransferase [Prosthecodimorpha staleyi]